MLLSDGNSKSGVQFGCQSRFASASDHLVHDFAVFDDEERRDGLDAEIGGHPGVVIDIHFADLDFPGILRGQFLHHGANHPARSAPRSPKINQYRQTGGKNFGGKIGVSEFVNRWRRHRVDEW